MQKQTYKIIMGFDNQYEPKKKNTYSQLQMLSQTWTQQSVQHTQHSKHTVELFWAAALAFAFWSAFWFILLFSDCGWLWIGWKSVVDDWYGSVIIYLCHFSSIHKLRRENIYKMKILEMQKTHTHKYCYNILTVNFFVNIYGAHFFVLYTKTKIKPSQTLAPNQRVGIKATNSLRSRIN